MLRAKMTTFERDDINEVVVGTVVDKVVEFQINVSKDPGQAVKVDTYHLYSHLLIRPSMIQLTNSLMVIFLMASKLFLKAA